MKKGWETLPLGELCDVLDYKRKPITKRDREAGEYPYYGATGILDHVAGYLFDEPLVLVGEDGAKWASGENSAFEVEGKIWVNNHAHVLRPHRKMLADKWLIYHINHSDLTDFVSGLTVPKLNQGRLREIPVPVPPLSEQQRIVGLLDEAFEGIATAKATAEKNLQNARALFESHLQSVFTQRGPGWVETALGSHVDLVAGFAFKSSLYTDDEDGIRLIRGDNIVQGKFRWEGVKRWPKESANEYSKFAFDENDVVLAMDRPWVAAGLKVAFVTKDDLPLLQVQRTARLRAKSTLDWKYLFHLIRSSGFIQYLLEGQTGLGVPHISGKQILSFEFPLPSIEDQRTIVEKLDDLQAETQNLARIYERKLAALEALKKSLLHQAFTGEL